MAKVSNTGTFSSQRVLQTSSRSRLETDKKTFDFQDSTKIPTRIKSDKRFVIRNRRRGLATASLRPTMHYNAKTLSSLAHLNFARESSPFSDEEARLFRVYALDSNGAQRCVHRWFTAALDRTLRLTTHAGLVLTHKERNRLQHALHGNIPEAATHAGLVLTQKERNRLHHAMHGNIHET